MTFLLLLICAGLLFSLSLPVSANEAFTQEYRLESDNASEQEYAFYADSYDMAMDIAEAYGGQLVSFQQGIGVIRGGYVFQNEELPALCMAEGDESTAETVAERDLGIQFYPEYTYYTQETLDEKAQWHFDYVKANNIWDKTKGAGVNVAVIDTGIDTSHQDFASAITYTASVVPEEYYEEGKAFYGMPQGVVDNLNHGTHVAGIIGARKNGSGCVGIAPECNLLIIKALEKNGNVGNGKSSWIAAAIRLAVNEGADVINLSLGGAIKDDQLLKEAIEYAVEKNAIVVCAAGNTGGIAKEMYPAIYDETITVSAVKKQGDSVTFASSYSNLGSFIDICAPGSSIMSTIPGGYGTSTGTSMACPMVAGAVALLKSLDKSISWQQAKHFLTLSAIDLGDEGRDDKYGAGMLDVEGMINEYLKTVKKTPVAPDVPNGNQVPSTDDWTNDAATENIAENEANGANTNSIVKKNTSSKNDSNDNISQVEGDATESPESTSEAELADGNEAKGRYEDESEDEWMYTMESDENKQETEAASKASETFKYSYIYIVIAIVAILLIIALYRLVKALTKGK